MHSFAQAVNLNSDSSTQHCLTQAFSTVLEKYLALKLILMTLAEMNEQEKLKVRPVVQMAGAKDIISKKPAINVDEKRAVATLVRSYLSGINLTLHHRFHGSPAGSLSLDEPPKSLESMLVVDTIFGANIEWFVTFMLLFYLGFQ